MQRGRPRTHMAKRTPGAVVASLSTPWGEAQTPGTSCTGGAITSSGPATRSRPPAACSRSGPSDGTASCSTTSGQARSPTGTGRRTCGATERSTGTASSSARPRLPILLARPALPRGASLRRGARRFWPMIRRAVAYIVRSGPVDAEDRWENKPGTRRSPSPPSSPPCSSPPNSPTRRREAGVATYLRETADAWNAAIDDWLYVEGTDLARRPASTGYYIRIAPPGWADGPSTATGPARPVKTPPLERDGSPSPKWSAPTPSPWCASAFARAGRSPHRRHGQGHRRHAQGRDAARPVLAPLHRRRLRRA